MKKGPIDDEKVFRCYIPDAGSRVAGVGGASAQANRYSCPLQKPQRVYGYAINVKSVIAGEETWTPNNVYLIFGPLHIKGTLNIQAGTVVCFDYGPPGTESNPEPPPGNSMSSSGKLSKSWARPLNTRSSRKGTRHSNTGRNLLRVRCAY